MDISDILPGSDYGCQLCSDGAATYVIKQTYYKHFNGAVNTIPSIQMHTLLYETCKQPYTLHGDDLTSAHCN